MVQATEPPTCTVPQHVSVQTLYSFHVGDCVEPSVYKDALERSCEVFDYARDELGSTLSVMDIGGGFEGFEHLQGRFERTSAVVSASVKTVFAAYPNVTVFAEPGRLFARRTSILLTRVIGKRWITKEEGKEVQEYINILSECALTLIDRFVDTCPHLCITKCI